MKDFTEGENTDGLCPYLDIYITTVQRLNLPEKKQKTLFQRKIERKEKEDIFQLV